MRILQYLLKRIYTDLITARLRLLSSTPTGAVTAAAARYSGSTLIMSLTSLKTTLTLRARQV